jgi:hypothetical protein
VGRFCRGVSIGCWCPVVVGCFGSHPGWFSFKVVRHSERGFSFGQELSECLGLLGLVGESIPRGIEKAIEPN